MLADFQYLLSLLCYLMPPGLVLRAHAGQGIKRCVSVCCFRAVPGLVSRCRQPAPDQPGRDSIFCPFMSSMCNSWTLSQMSVIFHSFGLSPFSPSSSAGVSRRPAGLLLTPAPHFQVPLGFRVNMRQRKTRSHRMLKTSRWKCCAYRPSKTLPHRLNKSPEGLRKQAHGKRLLLQPA